MPLLKQTRPTPDIRRRFQTPMPNTPPAFYDLDPTPIEVVEKKKSKSQQLVDKPKILVNLKTGRRVMIAGGMDWDAIVEQVCQDDTHPTGLYNVARGKAKTANGWTIEWPEAGE